MNCKKCGKEIDYEAEVCNECVAAEVNVEPVVEEVASAEGVAEVTLNNASGKNPKMIGFGKALTSLLLPIVGAIFIGIVCGILFVAAQGVYDTAMKYIENPELIVNAQTGELSVAFKAFLENDVADLAIFLLLLVGACIVAFVMSIIGVIFGIQSIKCFTREKKNGNKPIATLILGIAGTVESASMIFSIVSAAGSIALVILSVLGEVL